MKGKFANAIYIL